MKKIAVFDFDGTLIPFNSFKFFCIFFMFCCVATFNFSCLWQALNLFYSRKFKNLSHVDFKEKLCELYMKMGNPFCSFFSKSLLLFLRKDILTELRKWQSDAEVITVLSTAAPSAYALKVGDLLRCDMTIGAFGYSSNNFLIHENIGLFKADNLRNHFDGVENVRFIIAYSDSRDDISLFEMSEIKILVYPGKKDIAALDEKNINYEIFN